jgi:lysine decarboxylase
MKTFFKDKTLLKNCKIYEMLAAHSKAKHLSFHTPGHKFGKWDITELSFSDNLSDPSGCILKAEEDIAKILGAEKSFILTDGSTSGILSMLYAAKSLGVRALAFPTSSHKSVYNACALIGLKAVTFDQSVSENGLPLPPTLREISKALEYADGLLLTTPDYYGNIPPLNEIRSLCNEQGKPFLIDGAHGGHLHFDKTLYAGEYADMWVDGVHKSLPAFTQGAVVSARTEKFVTPLKNGVDIFRTTSPSYPIMASVEYAVKFPRNESLETKVKVFAESHPEFLTVNEDWTKLLLRISDPFDVQKQLEQAGFYPEFCDGNVIMFYLSPATKKGDFDALCKRLERLIKTVKPSQFHAVTPSVFEQITDTDETEWVELDQAKNRVCAKTCGLFPPCVPLLQRGEIIPQSKIELLKKADNTFGIQDNKILVVKN